MSGHAVSTSTVPAPANHSVFYTWEPAGNRSSGRGQILDTFATHLKGTH